jgi:hypothetical protein
MLITIGTLGIFPYFHTIESDVEYRIYRDTTVILNEKETLNGIIFYGWISSFSFNYFNSPNLFFINEGTGLEGAMLNVLAQRLPRRIKKKWSDKLNLPIN